MDQVFLIERTHQDHDDDWMGTPTVDIITGYAFTALNDAEHACEELYALTNFSHWDKYQRPAGVRTFDPKRDYCKYSFKAIPVPLFQHKLTEWP